MFERHRPRAVGGRKAKATVLPLAGHDHFTILEELASPNGALTAALRTLINGV